jgi:hypothetical protein
MAEEFMDVDKSIVIAGGSTTANRPAANNKLRRSASAVASSSSGSSFFFWLTMLSLIQMRRLAPALCGMVAEAPHPPQPLGQIREL